MSSPTNNKAILYGTNTATVGAFTATDQIKPVQVDPQGFPYSQLIGVGSDTITRIPFLPAQSDNDQDALAVGENQPAGNALRVTAFLHGFNGATMDRVRALPTDAATIPQAIGPLPGFLGTLGLNYAVDVASGEWTAQEIYFADADNLTAPAAVAGVDFGYVCDGANWDRVRSLASDTDAQAAAQVGLQGQVARGQIFNGTTWDRARSASAASQSAAVKVGLAAIAQPGEWTAVSTPAADTQATATRAAGAAGVRHVCTSIAAKLIGVAAIAAPILVNLRDGASGAGAILWSGYLFAGAANSKDEYQLTGLAIVGSAATAMTLEFAGAPGATNFESVALTGYSVS